jgi:hypothetical protein
LVINLSEHHNNIDLFDLYLNNALEGNERAQFEEKLINNAEFNKAFTDYKTLVLGIQDFGKIELKNYIKAQAINSNKGSNFKISRTFYAMAASVVLVIGLVFVFQQYSSNSAKSNEIAIEQKADEVSQMDTAIKQDQKFLEMEAVKKEAANETVMANVEEEKDAPIFESVDDADFKERDNQAPPSAGVSSAETESYKIVSERKLSDTVLLALYVDNASEKLMNKDANKLEKAAATKKLPGTYNNNNNYNNKADVKSDSLVVRKAKARAVKSDQYTIEYWQSPINFKGYKLVGYTLQLYGLGSSQASVKLYKVDYQLYLRMNGLVYELKSCTDGCAFSQTQADDIRELLLEQD